MIKKVDEVYMFGKQSMVGIFLLISLICVGYLSIKLGKMEIFGQKGYTITAQFGSIAGLRNGANVEIAGVAVGRVTKIYIDTETYMALVDMLINENISLSEDTMAAVKTSGLIGDKYIGLEPGGTDELLTAGAIIVDTESTVDIESLISKFVFGGV